MLSSKWFLNINPKGLGRHHRRPGEENGREEGGGGAMWHTVFWIGDGGCDHELMNCSHGDLQ